jgi:hypothetical protein
MNEGKDSETATLSIRKKYLANLNKTFENLETTDLQHQDLISTVLTIEKMPDCRLENGLDLRHKLFSENDRAIDLVTKFLRDRSMTIESMK